jgi:hypothetical protein
MMTVGFNVLKEDVQIFDLVMFPDLTDVIFHATVSLANGRSSWPEQNNPRKSIK